MVRKIIMAAAFGVCAAVYADEPVFEVKGVEISGYLDMSIVSTSSDAGDDISAGLDRAEVRFVSELADGVSIEAHVAGGSDEAYDLEQAHVVYSAIPDVKIVAGKFLSSLGWEAYHAPDLFQYSTSATLVYPGMQNGVGASYAVSDTLSVYAAALSGVWNSTDKEAEDGGFEGNVRFTGVEDFTLFVGAASEDNGDYDTTLLNIWASYVMGDWTFAAEANVLDSWNEDGDEGFGWLLMANYGITDKLAITLRTSALTVENEAGADVQEDTKFTIAPSYVLTDNMSFVLEYNTLEDIDGNSTDTVAFETIVTF